MNDNKYLTFIDHINSLNSQRGHTFYNSFLIDTSNTIYTDLEKKLTDLLISHVSNIVIPVGTFEIIKDNINKEHYDYLKNLMTTSTFEPTPPSKSIMLEFLPYYVNYGDKFINEYPNVSTKVQNNVAVEVYCFNKTINNDKQFLVEILLNSILSIFKVKPILEHVESTNKKDYMNILETFINHIEVEKIIDSALKLGFVNINNNITTVYSISTYDAELNIKAKMPDTELAIKAKAGMRDNYIERALKHIAPQSFILIIYAMGKLKGMGYIPDSYVPFTVPLEVQQVSPYTKPSESSYVSLNKEIISSLPQKDVSIELVENPMPQVPITDITEQSKGSSNTNQTPNLTSLTSSTDLNVFSPIIALITVISIFIFAMVIYLIFIFVSKK